MKTNLTKTQAKQCCGTNDLQPALKGLFYEPSKKTLTATNGHLLISYEVLPSDEDQPGIIPPAVFKTKKSESCQYETNGKVTRTNENSSVNFEFIDERFPDYESVIPEHPENSHTFGIDLNILKKLCDAVPQDENNKRAIEITLNLDSNLAPIVFRSYKNEQVFSGLMMPMRLVD